MKDLLIISVILFAVLTFVEICVSNFNLESTITPKSFSLSVCSSSWLFNYIANIFFLQHIVFPPFHIFFLYSFFPKSLTGTIAKVLGV